MPYDPLVSQKLFREFDNGGWKMLPGAAYIERLHAQLKSADEELRELSRRQTDFETARAGASRAAPPDPAPAAAGLPRADGEPINNYLQGAAREAAQPIPFKDTPNGLEEAAATAPKTTKRGRKPKLT